MAVAMSEWLLGRRMVSWQETWLREEEVPPFLALGSSLLSRATRVAGEVR